MNRSRAHTTFLIALCAVFISVLCWSGNFVVGRAIEGQIPPLHLSFWRWVLASMLLSPLYFTMTASVWQAVRKGGWLLCGLGLTGAAMFQVMVYIALQYTNASNATLLNAFNPIVVMVLAWVWLGERATLRQIIGISISFVGVGVLITRGHWETLLAMRFNLGDLWMLGAVIVWGFYSMLVKAIPKDIPPMVVVWATAIGGVVILLPFYLLSLAFGQGFTPNAQTLGAIAYVAIAASIIAFSTFNAAVARIGPTRTSYFLHLLPVFGALLAYAILGETLAPYHGIGFALTLSGVILSTTGRHR